MLDHCSSANGHFVRSLRRKSSHDLYVSSRLSHDFRMPFTGTRGRWSPTGNNRLGLTTVPPATGPLNPAREVRQVFSSGRRVPDVANVRNKLIVDALGVFVEVRSADATF